MPSLFKRISAPHRPSMVPVIIQCPQDERIAVLQQMYRKCCEPGNPFHSPKMQMPKIAESSILEAVLLKGEANFHGVRLALEERLGISFETMEYADAWIRVMNAVNTCKDQNNT